MTHDPVDDATIAQLVRDTAEGWTMPAMRLDAPSWRDRVRSPRVRRIEGARGWFGRVGQAATAAVALTVVGAMVAVVLPRPPQSGSTPAPSGGPTPGPTQAAASLLPRLLVSGAAPSRTSVVVQTESGDFSIVDLATGDIGGPITDGWRGSNLRVRADGSMVCLCVATTRGTDGMPIRATVTVDRFAADGTRTGSTPVDTFNGAPDPRDADVSATDSTESVLVAMSYSDDGRYGFVGWSLRAHPVWRSGVVLVDLQDDQVVDRLELPDTTDGVGTARELVTAPLVIGLAGGDGVFISQQSVQWVTPQVEGSPVSFTSPVFRVDMSGGRWSNLTIVPLATECGEDVIRGGVLPGGGSWLQCQVSGGAQTIVRRFAPDGSLIGDVRVTRQGAISGDTTTLGADGRTLFAWDPSSATLTAIDLATGEKTEGHGTTASAAADPLTAFGDWLAPAAAAKSILMGALVQSPDGTRIYAIGAASGGTGQDPAGSSGVFVFDAATLALVTHWDPVADLVSLAISTDGRYLYATGLPGVDAAGRRELAQGASVIVLDVADGAVRRIAGQLGPGALTFAWPTID